MSPIPSMIYNAAVGGHVTNSQQIIDEDYNLEQKDINKETLGIPYNASNPNGMGRIVLKKTDNFKEVVEAQTNGNTIFVIKYDFTLTDNVTIPANCVLEFDGGSISTSNNSKINTNNTYFRGDGFCAVALNGQFQYNEIDIFGVRPANTAAENSANIAKFMQSVSPKVHNRDDAPNNYIRFGQGVYNFAEPITIIGAGGVYGAGDGATHLIFANSDGLRFNMNILLSYMGLDISGFYIESSGNAIDLCYEHGGHTGTNVHNITIKAPNGAGITTTISSQNVYGCNFENIRFMYCKYCMANMSLMLNTTIKNCIDFSCRIWFYNCFFQKTYFIGGNVGWGRHLHFIYADKSWKPFRMIQYSLYVIGCNFEEFESNVVVIKKPADDPDARPIYYLTFDNCNFNNPQLSGHNIYDFDNEYSNLVEKPYTNYSEYYPIVGYEIVPKFINCISNIKNDNNKYVSIPIYAHTYNYSSHTDFNEVGAVIYVHAFLGDNWLNFIYNGKKVVSFKEMLDDPVISAKFTKFEMLYLRLGTRDSIFVNDSNSNNFSIDFDDNDWTIGNSFRIVTNNSNVVLLQGFACSGTNMNKSSVYNYFRVGGQYFNTTSNKLLTCKGDGWVDATGTPV